MTPYKKIYNSFLSKISEDEWIGWEEPYIILDLKMILNSAIPHFKFPRVDLSKRNEEEQYFEEDLSNEEIQILSSYMVIYWVNRNILSWENIKPLYEERDFSQANLIDKLVKLKQSEEENAKKLESIYYRSIKGKPFNYSKLAT